MREMGDRVAAVRKIAIAKRGVTPEADARSATSPPSRRSRPPKPFLRDWKRGSMEGFLFPALYEFTQFSTGEELVADQLAAFRRNFARVNLSYAKSKNLTPYDVLKIASMIEKETVAPTRAEARRGSDLQPPPEPDAARDRRHDPLRARHPGHEVADEGGDRERQPVQQPSFPGPAADADREPGPRVDQGGRASGPVDYLYYVRIPGTTRHFFTASESEFLRKVCEFGYACN